MTLFKENKKILFTSGIATLISMIISYIYLYIALPLNPDTVGSYFSGTNANLSVEWSIANGRWMRGFIEFCLQKIGYYNIVPFFTFILLILSCVFFNMVITQAFKLKHIATVIFISFSMFITPAFVELFSYFSDITTHIIFGILFLALSIYFGILKSNKFLMILFLVLSIGIYQSYFCIAATVFIVYEIYSILLEKLKKEDIIHRLVNLFVLLVLSIAIYSAISFIVLHLLKINSVVGSRFGGELSIISFIKNIAKMYGMLLILPFKNYGGINTTIVMKIVFLILFIMILYFLVRMMMNKSLYENIAIVLLILILPCAMNCIALIPSHTTIRMTQGLGCVFFLFGIFLELYISFEFPSYKKNQKLIFLSYVIMTIICLHGVYYANAVSYHSKLVTEGTKSYIEQIVSQIRMTEGYNKDSQVWLAGNFSEENLFDYYVYHDPEKFPLSMGYNMMLMPWEIEEEFKRLGAFKFNSPSSETIDKIKKSEEFNAMPIYPNYGSIKRIDNVIVVKFSE